MVPGQWKKRVPKELKLSEPMINVNNGCFLCGTMQGDFLPLQLIYAGKTA